MLIEDDFMRQPEGFPCVMPPRVITDEYGRENVVNMNSTCLRITGKGRTRLGRMDFVPSRKIVKKLREFYAPYNEKLFKLLGRRMNW